MDVWKLWGEKRIMDSWTGSSEIWRRAQTTRRHIPEDYSDTHRHGNLTSRTSSIRISNVFTFTSVLHSLFVVRDFLTEGHGSNSRFEDTPTSCTRPSARRQQRLGSKWPLSPAPLWALATLSPQTERNPWSPATFYPIVSSLVTRITINSIITRPFLLMSWLTPHFLHENRERGAKLS